ncbi:caspase family protein [Sphingomonas sp.]|uniref:caspase family protein n=1 Tax=Sphingomonas sp. TaxID=28214 RepID=UPI002DD63B8B|nr:caspase family protein [Sphingomonas sp.]
MTKGVVAALVGLLLATPAHADRALLIGVGSYPNLPASLRLQAPEEDARRLAAALTSAGFPRDRLELMTATDGTPPTRAAVLASLDRLAAEAVRGEQVLVYFSGHGAQAPTLTPALEPDGFDELYLMLDARAWDGGAGRVPGAVLDKELAARISAIRAKGADVWFVADACHAGGVFRSGGADIRTKALDTKQLSIPARVSAPGDALPPGLAEAPVDPAGAGRLAAFFAAAPGALAIERRLPLGSPDARPLSQFSYALARAIAAGRVRSLRDLAVAIEATDAGIGGGAPKPSFEGSLDMGVLGLTPDRPRRYPLARAGRTLSMPAGIEEGFAAGDRVALYIADTRVGESVVLESGIGASRLAMPPGLPPGAAEGAAALQIVGDAEHQAALFAAIAPLSARGAAEGLEVTGRLWRPGASRVCPPLSADDPPGTRPVSMLALPALGQCDVLIATIANRGTVAVDVSPIYFEADGKVTGLGYVGGGSARIGPGEQRRIAVRALTQDKQGKPLPEGVERVAIVALPAVTRSPRDLRGAVGTVVTRSGALASLDVGAGALTYRWRVEKR